MADINREHQLLLFSIRRSVRYHMRRRRFFEMWNRMTIALSIIFSSAAIITLLNDFDKIYTTIAAAIVTTVSTIDLVIGSITMSRLHTELARRFINLENEMALLDKPTDETMRIFRSKRLFIEEDEPPTLRVLNILCHNEVGLALGTDRSRLYHVPLIKRLLAQIYDIDDQNIRTYAEKAGASVSLQARQEPPPAETSQESSVTSQ